MSRLAAELGAELLAQFWQFVSLAPDGCHVAFAVDDHDVADDARLVTVRVRVIERELGNDRRILRVAHIKN